LFPHAKNIKEYPGYPDNISNAAKRIVKPDFGFIRFKLFP
jgi:hypothetical protein